MGQFYKGANEQNTHEGKQYWLSYISEPIVPVIAYNKSRLQQIGVPAPTDDWTFDDLAEFARRATTANAFGYFRGSSGHGPLRQPRPTCASGAWSRSTPAGPRPPSWTSGRPSCRPSPSATT